MSAITSRRALAVALLLSVLTPLAASAQERVCPANLKAPCDALRARVEGSCHNGVPGDLNTEEKRAAFHKALDGLLTLQGDANTKTQAASCIAACDVAPASERSCWSTVANKHMATRYEPKYEAELRACTVDHWLASCDRELTRAKGMWAEYVKFIVEQDAPVKLQTMTSIARTTPDTAYMLASDLVALLDDIKKKNQHPSLRADLGKLDARRAEAAKASASYKGKYEAAIARTRCPAGKVNDPGRLKLYRAQIDAFYAKTPASEPQRKVHNVQIQGKASSRYDRFEKTTFETVPLSACVELLDPRGARCYVWSLSIQRKKRDGQPWGGWDTVLVGARAAMQCQKLR